MIDKFISNNIGLILIVLIPAYIILTYITNKNNEFSVRLTCYNEIGAIIQQRDIRATSLEFTKASKFDICIIKRMNTN